MGGPLTVEAVGIVFVMITGGVLAATIATFKHREGVTWFVLGAFFPLIALIVVAVLPIGERQTRQEAWNQLRDVACPGCGVTTNVTARFCSSCGSPRNTEPERPAMTLKEYRRQNLRPPHS